MTLQVLTSLVGTGISQLEAPTVLTPAKLPTVPMEYEADWGNGDELEDTREIKINWVLQKETGRKRDELKKIKQMT